MHLFFNILDLFPLALEVLLPESDFIVATADGQDVTAQAPADTPQNRVEFENGTRPLAGSRCVRGPDTNSLVLGSGGDV